MLHLILPSYFTLAIIFTLIAGIVAILRTAEPSHQRRVFIYVILTWLPLMALIFFRQLQLIEHARPLDGCFNNNVIISGMWGFLSLTLYGSSVIFHKRFNFKTVLLFLLPAIIVVIADVAWLIYKDLPLNHTYADFAAIKADFGSITITLRLAMVIIQLLYISFLCYNITQLVPIYNKYIEHTESEERYKLSWLYNYITAISILIIPYFLLVISQSYWVQIIYASAVSITFAILIDCVRTFKFFPMFNEIKLQWTFKEGWIEEHQYQKQHNHQPLRNADKVCNDIDKWMRSTKQYCKPDFSMKDILAEYPTLTGPTLIWLFERRNTTFQTYIRYIRINEAIEIMRQSTNEDIQYKDVFYKVGFSHYSSFSRAFTAVMGVSPKNYKIN